MGELTANHYPYAIQICLQIPIL